MGRRKKSSISCLLGILLFAVGGCIDNADINREALLQEPPYQSISDSIRLQPQRPDLYLYRALLLSQNNLHEWATPDYKKAWELAADENAGMELSANLMLVNDTLGAIALLQECRNKYPQNETFYKRLSEIYAEIGKPAEALAEYDALLARDTANFLVYLEKGLLQLRLKDTLGAQQSLEQSYRLQPITQTALALANIYSLLKDPRVLKVCDAVLAKDTSAAITDAIFLKGIYFSDTKQYEKAVKAFDQCINQDWTFIDAYIEKGLVFYEQKKWAEARAIFEKATIASNTNADAYYWLGRTYESIDQPDPARENFLIALSLEPGFSEASEHLKRLSADSLSRK